LLGDAEGVKIYDIEEEEEEFEDWGRN
jgi:hypothetical protein